MESIKSIFEILNIIWDPVGNYLKYRRNLNENMNGLKRNSDVLNARKDDIISDTSPELHPAKKRKKEVETWLKDVEKINDEIQTIEKEVEDGNLSLWRLGKLVDMKIQEVEEHRQKGSFPEGLLVDAPPSRGETLPVSTLAGETTIKKNMEEIWACLMDDEVRKIGVYGMGGVGKTTVMKHIYNRLLKETDKFDNVIWVTVSKELDVIKLQNDIACTLNQDLSNHEDRTKRAGILSAMLRAKKRFVLILDDMWEKFFIEDVGILEPTISNGCKLVLTTRSLDVCRYMECKAIKVKPLSKEEAWKLFLEKVGLNVSQDQNLEATMKLVAEECHCLPLAIVTVACSMRDIYDIHEWENALYELRGSIKGVKGTEREVFRQLEFSYNRLKSSEVQQCFLHCAVYPEDSNIMKGKLVEYWVAEGLINRMDSMKAELDRGRVLINTLINSCLLESTNDEKTVKMHDLIRDMALNITRASHGFMVKAGMQLRDLPNEQDWTEDLQKISLMRNYISEIPSDMSPKCPKLSTLILQENHSLNRISDAFFVHMHALQVLDLSWTSIENLPNSISDLENLTALLLRGCMKLRYVPSLAKLRALRKLDLSYTGITRVPDGMEMLVNLRWLHLNATGILPKLSRLQNLVLYWGSNRKAVRVEELMSLRQLEIIASRFSDLRDFNKYVRSPQCKGLKLSFYSFRVGPAYFIDTCFDYGYNFYRFGKEVRLRKWCLNRGGEDPLVLPSDIQNLDIEECHFVSSCLWDLLSSASNNARDLKSCVIKYCRGIECVLSWSSSLEVKEEEEESCCSPLQSLEMLELIGLPDLSAFIKGGVATPRGILSSLKSLTIAGCSKIKKLFTPSLLQQHLEEIFVNECEQMEEIIGEEEGEGGTGESSNTHGEITLPKLRFLTLCELPKLKSICRGKMACDSLQEIVVFGCRKLKRLPLTLPLLIDGQLSPPPALKKINASHEWCESLEWDHPNAKNVLQPLIRLT